MKHTRPLALLLLAALGAAAAAAEDDSRQRLAQAKAAFDRKDYTRARHLAERIVRRAPNSPIAEDARVIVIDSYFEQQNLPRAYDECEKLLAARPQTKYRSAVLRREFQIGEALTTSRVNLLFFRLSRLDEGVKVLERVIEHAPFGPLADRALYSIGESHFRAGDYKPARDAYGRLVRQYPQSDLLVRARVRRATCNQRLAAGVAYDLTPARAAQAEMADLARLSGNEKLARYATELRDVVARSDYDSGLFYFGRFSIDGGVRYMKAVITRYPDTEYAERAERILALVKRLVGETEPGPEPKGNP